MEFKSYRTLAAIIITCLMLLTYFFWPQNTSQDHSSSLSLPTAHMQTPSQASTTAELPWQTIHIKPGDSLALIFRKQHIPYLQAAHILKLPLAQRYLTNVKPDTTLYLQLNQQQVSALKYPIDNQATLWITYHPPKFQAHIQKIPSVKIATFASATITSTLSQAAAQAGLNANLQKQLQNIFAGSVNFKRDLRAGDHFNIIYNQYYINGRPDHTGEILLAQLINHHKTYSAIRYTYPKNHTGYYTPQGHGIAPLFLKAPLKYRRISSYFSYARLDPYLKVIRPHYGVDYAAPIGTPIHTVGTGKVIFCGKDHGYGNAIIIRYSHKYKALYAHLHRFATGIHAGIHVKKGQLIGYVGTTGWSTGPHLHFGWFVNGIPKDPLKRPFLYSPPIPKSYMPSYAQHANELLAKLHIFQGSELAKKSDSQTTPSRT